MSLILQAAWVTQASDFITQSWYILLGILGGSGGIVALFTFIGKLILTCVKGKIDKRNNSPLQKSYDELKQEIREMIELLKILIDSGFQDMKEELKIFIIEQLEKSQKMKIALYDKLVTEGENAQDLLDELNEKIEEAQALVDVKTEPTEADVAPEMVEDIQVVEPNVIEEKSEELEPLKPIKKKHKAKKVVVER